MTFVDRLCFRGVVWFRAPGWSDRDRFARALATLLVVMAETRAGRDLTFNEATAIVTLFVSWSYGRRGRLADNPVRELSVFFDNEPWAEAVAGERPEAVGR